MPVLDLKKEMMINMYLVQVTQTLLNAYVSTRTLDFCYSGSFQFYFIYIALQVFEILCTISQFLNQ